MSLNWNWNDKMGTCTMQVYGDPEHEVKANLYRGNAFVIAILEWDDKYELAWFACDKDHMKNMLGLSKDYTGCWSDFHVTELELNTNYKETAQFVQMLAKAKVDVTIKLFSTPW